MVAGGTALVVGIDTAVGAAKVSLPHYRLNTCAKISCLDFYVTDFKVEF